MARKTRQSSNQGQRDYSNQSLDSLLTFKLKPPPVLLPVPVPVPVVVREAGDRRLFRPDRSTQAPHSTRPGAARVVARQTGPGHGIKFADPAFVSICARRSIRKQVLFALRRTRKGSRSPKRNNFWSAVSCSAR